MKRFQNVLFVIMSALSIVGAIVGVGFVSGKEIVSFFFVYGDFAEILAIVVSILLCFSLSFSILNKHKENNHLNKNRKTEEMNLKYKHKICLIKNKIIGLLCMVITATMLGGMNSLFNKLGNVHFGLRLLFMLIFVVFVSNIITRSNKFIVVFSGVMTFLLSVVMIAGSISGLTIGGDNLLLQESIQNGAKINILFTGLCSAIFYVSMNMLSCSGLILKTAKRIKNKWEIVLISLLSSLILGILIILIIKVLRVNFDATRFDMPMLEIAKSVGNWFYYIYFGFLMSGCIISIISVAYSGKVYLFGDTELGQKVRTGLLFMIVAYIISLAGFDFLVEKIYPAIGMIYLLLSIFSLLLSYNFKRKSANN